MALRPELLQEPPATCLAFSAAQPKTCEAARSQRTRKNEGMRDRDLFMLVQAACGHRSWEAMALGSTKPSQSQLNLSHTAARHARLSKRLAFKCPLCHFLVWRIRNVSGKHWKQPQKGAAFYKASAILSLCSGDDTTAASGARGGCKAKAPRVPHLPGAVQLCTLTSYRKHSIASPSGSHDVTDKAIRHSFVFPISSTRDFAPESVPLDPKARPGPPEWLE